MRDLRPIFLPSLRLAILLLTAQTTAVHAQAGKLLPVDEAVRDPELFAFRARLQEAVARHDVAALLEAVDPNIKVDFGGGGGIADFRNAWKLQDGDKSPLWAELGLVLALGGAFQGDNLFAAPYVFTSNKVDAYEQAVVLGTNVRVRAEPRVGSPVLATLSFDIVRLSQAARSRLTPEQAEEWTAVELQGGRTGYIASRYVRSPIDYRALFNKIDGRWRMTAFVAGD
jgi:hypothetical protein